MPKRLHKLMLLLLVLSLAAMPLRGTLALPADSLPDSESHCAGMQHDVQHAMPEMPRQDASPDAGHQCQDGCNGDCCDTACNGCVHPATALPGNSIPETLPHQPSLQSARITGFTDRTVIPPLRPPASP